MIIKCVKEECIEITEKNMELIIDVVNESRFVKTFTWDFIAQEITICFELDNGKEYTRNLRYGDYFPTNINLLSLDSNALPIYKAYLESDLQEGLDNLWGVQNIKEFSVILPKKFGESKRLLIDDISGRTYDVPLVGAIIVFKGHNFADVFNSDAETVEERLNERGYWMIE